MADTPMIDPFDPDCPIEDLLKEHERRHQAGEPMPAGWEAWVEDHYWPARDALRRLLYPGIKVDD